MAEGNRVFVYLYDLSNGMARQMSPGLIGRQIEGIWHTAVVVYGQEYFYGGGICTAPPGQSMAGPNPYERIDMGVTTKTQREFDDWCLAVSGRFTMEAYHLLNHNCNNFTDEACRWLVGQPIPAHITGLPADVMSTPFGRMIEPFINQMMQAKNTMMAPISQEAQVGVPDTGDFLTHDDVFPALRQIRALHEVEDRTQMLYIWDSADPVSVDFAFAHSEVLGNAAEEAKDEIACLDLRKVGGFRRPDTVPCVQVRLGSRIITVITDVTPESVCAALRKVTHKFTTLRLNVNDPILYQKGALDQARGYITKEFAAISEGLPPEAKAVLEAWTTSGQITNIPKFMQQALLVAGMMTTHRFAFLDIIKILALQDSTNRVIIDNWELFEHAVSFEEEKSAKLSFQAITNLFASENNRLQFIPKHAQFIGWVRKALELGDPKCMESGGFILFNLCGLVLAQIEEDDHFIELVGELVPMLAEMTDANAIFALCNGLAPILIANEELKGLANAMDLTTILEGLKERIEDERVRGIATDLVTLLS